MSAWLIAVVTVLYLGTAVSYWLRGDKPMAIVFAGYAAANIGFILADIKGSAR